MKNAREIKGLALSPCLAEVKANSHGYERGAEGSILARGDLGTMHQKCRGSFSPGLMIALCTDVVLARGV